jgi:hypothetical protein
MCDGCGTPAVRGNRHIKEGRQGVRPDPGKRQEAHHLDGDDVGAMTNQILALCEHLVEQKVTCVVMEATGDYWKPFVRHEALEIEWG